MFTVTLTPVIHIEFSNISKYVKSLYLKVVKTSFQLLVCHSGRVNGLAFGKFSERIQENRKNRVDINYGHREEKREKHAERYFFGRRLLSETVRPPFNHIFYFHITLLSGLYSLNETFEYSPADKNYRQRYKRYEQSYRGGITVRHLLGTGQR